MTDVTDQIESAKETATAPLPTPPEMNSEQANPNELLKRLNWGEPALTIIDIRDRQAFNNERITGAISLPKAQLAESLTGELEYSRDIYLYGESVESAAEAASELQQAGYKKVAVIQGGLSGWKKADGPTEGIEAFSTPVG